MDADTPIKREDAEAAEAALIMCIADLLETAADLCAAPAPASSVPRIVSLCQDGAALAQAVEIIARRAYP